MRHCIRLPHFLLKSPYVFSSIHASTTLITVMSTYHVTSFSWISTVNRTAFSWIRLLAICDWEPCLIGSHELWYFWGIPSTLDAHLWCSRTKILKAFVPIIKQQERLKMRWLIVSIINNVLFLYLICQLCLTNELFQAILFVKVFLEQLLRWNELSDVKYINGLPSILIFYLQVFNWGCHQVFQIARSVKWTVNVLWKLVNRVEHSLLDIWIIYDVFALQVTLHFEFSLSLPFREQKAAEISYHQIRRLTSARFKVFKLFIKIYK